MKLERRDFLKIVGGATVATALPACTPKKPQSLIPYIIPHEEIIPGKAVWYASVCRECPAGCGVRARVREGRAVKIEGNPLSPINKGTLCARGQASLHGLYNPDRIQHPLRKRSDGTWEQLTWEQAEDFLLSRLGEIRTRGRRSSVAWITSHTTGSVDTLTDEVLAAIGSRRRIRYEPLSCEAIKEANRITFGRAVIPSYDFASARMIVSFGADFLETWLSPLQYTRDYTTARTFNGHVIPRSVYVGPRLSLTAANADEWVVSAPGTEHILALAVLSEVLATGRTALSRREAEDVQRSISGFTSAAAAERTGVDEERIKTLARDLVASGPSLIVAGGTAIGNQNELQTCIAVNLLNDALGNIGRTIDLDSPSPLTNVDSFGDLARFTRSMEQREIDLLFLTETNPVFSTPAKLKFADAMSNVPVIVAFSSFMDETTALATLVLPIHTALESWGDYVSSNSVTTLQQPVMQPVFSSTRMLGDILVRLKEKLTKRGTFSAATQPFYEYVRARWRSMFREYDSARQDFERWWVEALASGVLFRTRSRRSQRTPARLGSFSFAKQGPSVADFTLVTYPSLTLYDGRGANKPWLQELPDPITQITWENWVEIHPDDAKNLGIERGDIVRLTTDQGTLELPAYVYHGIRQGSVAVPVGQGHSAYGRYAKGNGANVIDLLSPNPMGQQGSLQWSGTPVRLAKVGGSVPLADVAGSDYVHGRNIVQVVTIDEILRQTTELAQQKEEKQEHESGLTLYPPHEHPDHRWGMTIDLDKCTGCSACVTACYAENNIPVVGKHQVEIGRELTWLRIERYFDNLPSDPSQAYVPKAEFLPMMCQQCDNAPCEPVCPVYASYHTPEGLNAQVYNRCVGTRYCANNCPYKVRRFNWFDYEFPEPLNWQLNPDVTVRTKGVMEKCTFCIQRVVEVKSNAKLEGRAVQDGEITTACQQSCPTEAIVFGDLKDPESRVNKLREAQRNRGYRILEELNTEPAVVYLKEIRS